MAVNGHMKVIMAAMRRPLRRLVVSGVQTAVARISITSDTERV